MTVLKLAFTLLAAACIVNAYGPIKGGKKHRTTTPFPIEEIPLPADNANSILGEPQYTTSSSQSSSGAFWWQGNNPFGGGSVGQQPSLPSQPQQGNNPFGGGSVGQQPSLPSQPQQGNNPFGGGSVGQQPSLPSPPQQGNPFLSGLKQSCTAANHYCVQKQLCLDGLIVSQKKPLHSSQGQCDVATQICCKLAISSQPGVVTQVNQPGTSTGHQTFTSTGTANANGQNLQPTVIPGQQGPVYGIVSQTQQPGFISVQPNNPGFVGGSTDQSQQPEIIHTSVGQTSSPGLVSGNQQLPGVTSGQIGNAQNPGFIHGPGGQPQRTEFISKPTGQGNQPGLIHGSQQPGLIHSSQQPGLIHSSQQPGLIHGSQQPGLIQGSQNPDLISGNNNNDQQPAYIYKPGGQTQLPGINGGNPQFISPSTNTQQYYRPSPGNNGVPIGGSIFDTSVVTPNPSQKPYTGPLNTTPYPGCAAALKCVRESFCTAEGVMSNVQITLTREQFENKVPLTDCVDPDTGIEGKCCRDPNYKDPWPAGMMMPNGGHNHGHHTLPDECNPFGNCLHSYQCGEQNTLRPLKSCRVPLDGASGVCCSSGTSVFQTGQQVLSTGASSNSQSLSKSDQNQTPIINSGPGNSLANNPFITQAGLNTANDNRQPSFQVKQPQGQYQPQNSGQTQTSFLPGSQNQHIVILPGTPPTLNIKPSQENFPNTVFPSQPNYQTEKNIIVSTFSPGFQQQPNDVFPTQKQQNLLPGLPTQTQVVQQPETSSKPQLTVPAATGQGSVVLVQPPRTYPSPSVTTITQQYIPGKECGLRRQVSRDGLSKYDCGFGEFPWQALIVDNNNQSGLCSGAIIAPNAVITTAHCLDKVDADDILVKAGLWRLNQATQPKPVQISSVAVKSVHPKFESNSLFNDMAILILNDAFIPDQNVDFICLPESSNIGPQNSCVATGWGKNALQGTSRDDVLHQVPVQFVQGTDCQQSYRTTFLGSYFQLHNSFQCAVPMSPDVDLCKVGVGSPIACESGDSRYVLSGLYSWDLGCSSTVTPTALSRLDVTWIRSILNTPVEALLAVEESQQEQQQQQLDVIDAENKPGFSQGYGR